MVLPALRVANSCVGCTESLEHRARDFARVRARFVLGNVLTAVHNPGTRTIENSLNSADVNKRRKNSNLDGIGLVAGLLEVLDEVLKERLRLDVGEVHLPVACNKRCTSHDHFSSRMAIPGSSLPSISSRLAPPPVEMCE